MQSFARFALKINTVKLGQNKLGYNKLCYNDLGYNELGYNELGYNKLGYNELGYNEPAVITNPLLYVGRDSNPRSSERGPTFLPICIY